MKEQLLNDNFELYRNSLDDCYKSNCIKGFGNINAKIALVGEAPGATEIKLKQPFVGSAGKNLDIYLELIGLSRNDLYITNTIKYRPVKKSSKTEKEINRTPTVNEIKNSIPYLINELLIIKPNLVITLGNISLKALTQNFKITISDVHGKILPIENDLIIFPLYHPASIIYNNSLKTTYERDVLQLKKILNQ